MSKQFSHAATVFHVKDPLATAKFYRDKLGFSITFEWGDPVEYVVTNREETVSIHFSQRQGESTAPAGASMYIFVHDVDALHEEFQQRSVPIHNPIGTRDYGMRDFDILDPDGHMLCFGTGVERLEE